MRKFRKLWLVAHDAGGAEMVACWYLQQARARGIDEDIYLIAEGPAVAIFSRRLPSLKVQNRQFYHPEANDLVVSGTGWASDLERLAVTKGKSAKSYVVSILDHWVNYRERYSDFPDEIWLGDADAFRIAEKVFSAVTGFSTKLVQIENPYLIETVKEINAVKIPETEIHPGNLRILYLCEAISEHEKIIVGGKEIPEFVAARRFFDWLELNKPAEKMCEIRMRLHPSEQRNKYDLLLRSRLDLKIHLSQGSTLVEDCAWSEWVVGMSSMALVVALMSNRKVISCMPRIGDVCPLPHSKIERI